jgi:predicted nucleic acid-binding protein
VRACQRARLQADDVHDLMRAVETIVLAPGIVRAAGLLPPPALRSLDAIHLASARHVNDPDLEFVTYDARLADAARANGLRVVQPGR